MKVFLVCGVIGAGKDFFFKNYKREHPGKKIAQLQFASVLRFLAGKIYNVDLSDEKNYEDWKAENREKLVYLGDYLKEAFGENILAKGVTNQLKEDCTYIITDFRFPIEFFSVAESANLKDITVVFMNFKSERYCLKPEQTTERMACWLVSQGYEDKKEWDYWQFEKVMKRYQDSLLSTK